MDDTPHHEPPADWEPPPPSEVELLAALARSDAEVTDGLTVPAAVVHQRIRDAIARIESRKHARQTAGLD
jgi:hypothetical protein